MIRANKMTGLMASLFLVVMLVGIIPTDASSATKRTYTWSDGKEMPYPEYLENAGEFEMVLIHGLGANTEIWDSILPYLSGTFKVWTFELSGHGLTQPTVNPSIESEAKRLADFLKEEGIVYPTLVGHGMGGMIALQFAMEHPADAHRLIMIDSAPMQLATKEQKELIGNAIMEDYDRFVAGRYMNMSFESEITEKILWWQPGALIPPNNSGKLPSTTRD